MKVSRIYFAIAAMLSLGFSKQVFASDPTYGVLLIVNGLANVQDGSTGNTASSIAITVSDASGVCTTISTVAYGGSATVRWDASKTHSSSQCTGITSVAVKALKNFTGLIQYDSVVNVAPSTAIVATGPTTFLAPTQPITNLVLIITGNASATTTAVGVAAWGIDQGTLPVYDANNASLQTVGIMDGVGALGWRAAALMRNYGVKPVMREDE